MSGEKPTNPCNKFQANVFNKSKCQNCFKSREVHLLKDHNTEQVKPIYSGWLCLAPEGTDFDNRLQRSRKWQRRYFILDEQGSLSYALDELPSTLPQGTVNMNLCTDITDAEGRTGQKNSLCIVTPMQEIFIRDDHKEIMNGWSEHFTVYLRTNKQNHKKKRKVEPPANQEPSPAKMAATDPSFPSLEEDTADSGQWQKDQRAEGPDVTPVRTGTNMNPPGPDWTPAGNASSYLCPLSRGSLTLDGTGSFANSVSSQDLVAVGSTNTSNSQLAESNVIQTSANVQNKSRDRRDISAGRLLGVGKELRGGTMVSRQGRTEARTSRREKLQSCGDTTQLGALPPQRRSKSLDRRTSDTVMTPDLLNFKKGWMVKLDENDQWKKYWFVLSADSLRYYRDATAEETSDLNGEIDLTKCYNVSDYDVPRNYGFQIHTPKGVFTLSAMTAGIRKNWIQALMKNVHPVNAPDVASLPGHHVSCSPPGVLPKPDVTQDSASSDVSTETDPQPHPSSAIKRRQQGCYKSIDWSEFRPRSKSAVEVETRETKPLCSLEVGDLEGRRRREARRRKYETMLGISLGFGERGEKTVDSCVRAPSPKSQQRVEEEIEEFWRQVEKFAFRAERMVPLFTETRNTAEVEELLQSYRKQVEELKVQLAESEHHRLKLEAQLSTDGFCQQQVDPLLCSEADFCPVDMIKMPLKGLKNSSKQTSELLQQPHIMEPLQLQPSSSGSQLPSIWLHDDQGSLQQVEAFPPVTDAALLASPASNSQSELSQTDGTTSHHWNQLFPNADTKVNNSDFLILKPAERDDDVLNHVAPDKMILKRLSQEVELLSSQNEALNQRNQEMLNQLTEADREIERLKAELNRRYTEEHQGKMRLEDLQKELSSKNEELLEAQMLITSLKGNLRETEALLQLNSLAETEGVVDAENKKNAEIAEEYLLLCFEPTEAKLAELERQLQQSELTCRELQHHNKKLKEAGERYSGRAAEELEKDRPGEEERNRSVSGNEKIQKVIEGMVLRLGALEKLLEIIDGLSFIKETEEEEECSAVMSQLKWEEKFWSLLLKKLNEDPSEMKNPVAVILREMMERMKLEKQMLLVSHDLLLHSDKVREGVTAVKDLGFMWDSGSLKAPEATKINENRELGFDKQQCEMEQLKAVTQVKISLLKQISSISTSVLHKLQLTADTLYDFHFSDPWTVSFVHSAATEALYRCHLNRIHSRYQTKLCQSCVSLAEENKELKASLSNLEEKQLYLPSATMNTCCQTDESFYQSTGGNPAEETLAEQMVENQHHGMEIPLLSMQKISDEHLEESDEDNPNVVMEQMLELRVKVKELEEQVEELSVLADQMNHEFGERMSSVKEQHEKEMEKLKATCERGLTSMTEYHLKEMEEHQRLHQEELERLLMERDRLLEEESAATATAIEAITRAHHEELQREVQRTRPPESSHGNTQLEDIYRQHREELDSIQRELHVLSQQFSLKCLENRHLVQALDAERKALCQCQLENQDLRIKNQELSGHLATEVTRLCSLAKQDTLPLSQEKDLYEMEITLGVKEFEVQSLKQKITSLKEELQSALKDKRDSAKEYKDMLAELSFFRAKAEREADELREQLRLAHRAVAQTSP
ncbi:myosin phosphatase Rho-interacting protein-like [Melanotaenia boesemani]|uniref:myosin phosphatase Rho-interacting protein-like n=1 Tax=Melanotaenia boesemani TaxID=1250792 RepID=UPI001C05C8C6|nr:myosin phosphatase Rho-interacting protein-like [Melanotaenia boesemani]